ncbi:DUF4783 domain-containing protein [Lewinella sp. 4G2]|uniref:DUF4783 domain-containing protein n=1 Tax=Lewinella sp. 4G2 TaxID=1803372 RepID=UPI0007B4C5FA|nr:DUF4783 domain-containing protein [Lewinella sp. 4G2]OAV44189.1 hypothetical protein A3850_006640 [Lewinella sp. 4G2]
MKLLLFFISGLFFAGTPAVDQTPVSLESVCKAVGSADVRGLMAAMGSEVELSILDEEDMYSKADAGAALEAFYKKFSKTNFGKVHQGASKSDDAEYCIGTLSTDKGSYRVYVYVAKQGGSVVLQELRFDPS